MERVNSHTISFVLAALGAYITFQLSSIKFTATFSSPCFFHYVVFNFQSQCCFVSVALQTDISRFVPPGSASKHFAELGL